MDLEPPIKCDLVGFHILDPNGDVTLVFNSKHVIVSDADTFILKNAEKSNTEGHAKKTYELGTADIQVRASSHILALLSPYFQALLHGNFAEANTLRKDGHVQVVMEDDAAHGALLLLRLMHWDCNMPKLTLSLMMQVSELVDRWRLADNLSYWLRQWWNTVYQHELSKLTQHEETWLAMVSMLGLHDEREKWIRYIQSRMIEVPYGGNPLLDATFELMAENRLKILEKAFRTLKRLIDSYFLTKENTTICLWVQTSCDAAVLGSLLRELKAKKLYPLPETPFCGIHVVGLLQDLKALKIVACRCTNEGPATSRKRKRSTGEFDSKPLEPVIQVLEKFVSDGDLGKH